MEKIKYVKLDFVEQYNKEFVTLSHEDYCVQKEGHLDWVLSQVIEFPYLIENIPKLVEETKSVIEYEEVAPEGKRKLIVQKASFLLFHLAAGHIFIEANKRISLFIFVTFLRLNGFDVKDGDSLLDNLFNKITSRKPSADVLFKLVIALAGCEEINGKKENCVIYKNPEDIIYIIQDLVV